MTCVVSSANFSKTVRSKQRVLTSGRVIGGCSFGRGALYHLLRNRIYRGEVVHKGIVYPGAHKAIVEEEPWTAVQARLADNCTTRRKSRVETGALLGGLIYDDRGNIMSPTYSVRQGNRYRYYISSALLHDRRTDAGSRARVNADDIEQLVVEVLGRELSRPALSVGGPSMGGATRRAQWCGTPLSGSLFKAISFTSAASQRHRPRPQPQTKTTPHRGSTSCRYRLRGLVPERRSLFPVGITPRRGASTMLSSSPSPAPSHGCETFATERTRTR